MNKLAHSSVVYDSKKSRISDAVHVTTSSRGTLTENVPVPLRNKGEKICFFNVVLQSLYSLLPFRLHIYNTMIDNKHLKTIKSIFQEMDRRPNNPINTYQRIADWNIPGYNHASRQQMDPEDLLMLLIRKSFDVNLPLADFQNL